MSYAERHEVAITTDGAGNGTGYVPVRSGHISQIRYVKTDYDNGVTFAITAEATGETIWGEAAVNASKTVAPRQATHTTAGVAAVYAAAGEPVLDKIAIADDRVKIVVSLGGAAHTGTFYVMID